MVRKTHHNLISRPVLCWVLVLLWGSACFFWSPPSAQAQDPAARPTLDPTRMPLTTVPEATIQSALTPTVPAATPTRAPTRAPTTAPAPTPTRRPAPVVPTMHGPAGGQGKQPPVPAAPVPTPHHIPVTGPDSTTTPYRGLIVLALLLIGSGSLLRLARRIRYNE